MRPDFVAWLKGIISGAGTQDFWFFRLSVPNVRLCEQGRLWHLGVDWQAPEQQRAQNGCSHARRV
jgi:hypothetical protein